MDWSNDISYEKADGVTLNRCGRMACVLVHKDTPAVINGKNVLILGPSLVCLNGHESLVIKSGEVEIIKFTVKFLCRSVTDDMMRQEEFWELANEHNLFFLSPFLNGGDYENGVIYLNPHIYSFMREQFENVNEAIQDKSNGRWSCYTRSYLMEILLPFEKEKLQGIDQFKLKKNGTAWQLVTYIQNHYGEHIDPNELAQMYGHSRNDAFTIFRAETGHKLTDYIIQYRLFIAKHILAFTEVPVYEISQRVGYENQSSFTRMFKERMGITPDEFRKQAVEARKAELNKNNRPPARQCQRTATHISIRADGIIG